MVAADKTGGQLKEIQKYLMFGDANHEIEYVWYDYWCVPQKNPTGKEKSDKDYDERTQEQKAAFDHMLTHANFLYLGCKVLIVADKSYVSRFWTMFEAWVAMRQSSKEGLVNAPEGERRWVVRTPLDPLLASVLEEVLTISFTPDANADKATAKATQELTKAKEILEKPDIEVTNASDKKKMIKRLDQLDKLVKNADLAGWRILLSAAVVAAMRNKGTPKVTPAHPNDEQWATDEGSSPAKGETVVEEFEPE